MFLIGDKEVIRYRFIEGFGGENGEENFPTKFYQPSTRNCTTCSKKQRSMSSMKQQFDMSTLLLTTPSTKDSIELKNPSGIVLHALKQKRLTLSSSSSMVTMEMETDQNAE